MIPLSILDLSVVTTGTRPAAALRNSIDLARHADALGYARYWLAEHHNLSSVASPADRKSTRLNSSHLVISYAVFCLKKKTHRASPIARVRATAPARRS